MAAKLSALSAKELKGEYFDITVNPPVKCTHGGHFKYMTPREVMCMKCHMGLLLDGRDRLVDGHLYSGDKLVI